jgi:hypothetical protein
MSKIKLLVFAATILFGVFMIVYGGFDDSPGAQLVGVLAVILGIVGIIKNRNK